MDRGPEWTFFQDVHTNAQEIYEKCSTSLAIKEIKIKTTIKYHHTPIKMATINKTKITNIGKNVEKMDPPICTVGNVNWYRHYGKSMEVPQNIKNGAIIWPSNPSPEYLREKFEITYS